MVETLARTCLRIQDTEVYAGEGTSSHATIKGEHLVDERYFRALAKMALGYCLWANPSISGRENQLGLARDFIRWGVGRVDFFFAPSSVAADSPLNRSDWPGLSHLFVASHGPHGLEVWLKLYAAPGLELPPYQIRLSRTSLGVGSIRSAHAAIYLTSSRGGGDGAIVSVETEVVGGLPPSSESEGA